MAVKEQNKFSEKEMNDMLEASLERARNGEKVKIALMLEMEMEKMSILVY